MSTPPSRTFLSLVVFAGVLGVSFGSLFVRWADAPALVLSFYRTAIAALIFGLHWKFRAGAGAPVCRRDLLLCLFAGGFLALHFVTWISSLGLTSVAASVTLVNTCPVWVALASPFVTGDRVTRGGWMGIAVTLAGSAWMVFQSHGGGGPHGWKGDLLALSGAVALSAYLLIGRNLRARMSLPQYACCCYGSSALLLLLAVPMAGTPLTGYSATTWAAIAGLAIVSQVLGHSCNNYALRWVPPGLVAVILIGEPVFGTLLAAWLLHEPIPGATLLSMAVILLGIALTLLSPAPKDTDHAAPGSPAG